MNRPKVLLIGASTGGPGVVRAYLQQLSSAIEVPILIVQHMSPDFIPTLAAQIARESGRICVEVKEDQMIEKGKIYLASGGHHMGVRKNGVRTEVHLSDAEPENFCRPAVDFLFRSAAETFGRSALAIVFTGMGEDGAKGAQNLRASGGSVMVQDEASSVVWGMPGAVVQAGAAEFVLSVEGLLQKTHEIFGVEAK